MLVLVAGAGGFIGGHLVRALLAEGHDVRAVDKKPREEWFQLTPLADNRMRDLRTDNGALDAVAGVERVFNLACDMGGMGFIETHKADCMVSVLINTNLLRYGKYHGVQRHLFASSACVYNAGKQIEAWVPGLKEDDAYPADPEDGYGWEKLFSERMCRHFFEDYGMETRVARIHNCYGPHGSWEGGREKAPAAMCRKALELRKSGRRFEIWGDGKQTRSFMYIDDCVRGLLMLMDSDVREPLNIGTPEQVEVFMLAEMACNLAGLGYVDFAYKLDAPQGVRGRNADLGLVRKRLGWEPRVVLRQGMEATFKWIESQFATR